MTQGIQELQRQHQQITANYRTRAFIAAGASAYTYQHNVKESITCEVQSCPSFSIGQAYFKALLV